MCRLARGETTAQRRGEVGEEEEDHRTVLNGIKIRYTAEFVRNQNAC